MTDTRLTELIERAFDYRGNVTLLRHDGTKLVGFIYDRGPSHVEMFDEQAAHRIRVGIDEIADLVFSGEDCAARAQRAWERRRGSLEPRETPVWGEWEDRPMLIIVALPIELRVLAHVLGARIRGDAVRGRFGETRAVSIAVGMRGSAAHAIAAESPRLVVSCGFSGALVPSLGSGALVLASSVRDESGESISVAEEIIRVARHALRGRTSAEGEILCTSQVAATRAEKHALARPGRLAVDLESWAAARAAADAGIPWLGLRAVLDPLDLDLPAFTREPHASHLEPALRHALGGPSAAVELARLGLRARAASRSLEQALRRLGPALAHLGAREVHS